MAFFGHIRIIHVFHALSSILVRLFHPVHLHHPSPAHHPAILHHSHAASHTLGAIHSHTTTHHSRPCNGIKFFSLLRRKHCLDRLVSPDMQHFQFRPERFDL